MLWLSLLACGDKPYDIETWQSPLASQADEDGDAARGEEIYATEHWTDASPYALTCVSCHSAESSDVWTDDSDAFTRPAHTTWNAAYRETWKVSHGWDNEESDVNGAYGGQVCVRAYFPAGSEMSAQQAADLEAYMRDNRDDDASAETASELDYSFTSWDSQDDFFAQLSDGAGGFKTGADLGDVDAGKALTFQYCGSCHSTDGSTVTLYSLGGIDTGTLVQRIRKVDLDDADAPNDRMPRIPEDRLSDDDLADILAFLTQTPEE